MATDEFRLGIDRCRHDKQGAKRCRGDERCPRGEPDAAITHQRCADAMTKLPGEVGDRIKGVAVRTASAATSTASGFAAPALLPTGRRGPATDLVLRSRPSAKRHDRGARRGSPRPGSPRPGLAACGSVTRHALAREDPPALPYPIRSCSRGELSRREESTERHAQRASGTPLAESGRGVAASPHNGVHFHPSSPRRVAPHPARLGDRTVPTGVQVLGATGTSTIAPNRAPRSVMRDAGRFRGRPEATWRPAGLARSQVPADDDVDGRGAPTTAAIAARRWGPNRAATRRWARRAAR